MASEEIPEDRFTAVAVNNVDNLCFLCLKEANNLCQHCSIPFCSTEHFEIHYDEKNNYCYPFRVLQRPEVSFLSRSAHRTTNFTNSEFQFPQFKVLQSVFIFLCVKSYIGIF